MFSTVLDNQPTNLPPAAHRTLTGPARGDALDALPCRDPVGRCQREGPSSGGSTKGSDNAASLVCRFRSLVATTMVDPGCRL